tara:strand:- start:599 stop:3055 length:2457 start_codon:yes stop_codon:yes gene_type:complete
MKKYIWISAMVFLFLEYCGLKSETSLAEFSTPHFRIEISDSGNLMALTDPVTGKNHLAQDSIAPLLSIRVKGIFQKPQSASLKDDILYLQFAEEREAQIKITSKQSYLTFELIDLSPVEEVELILWGPYPTTIHKIIGETVGVVRGETYAMGIQSLNIKTLGGYPWHESDRMPQLDIFRAGDHSDMATQADDGVLYRVEAAKPTTSGSSLQAYSRNRNKARIVEEFSHDKIVVPPYDDGGVVGSKMALFGSPIAQALETLGAIELGEGLPHPMIDGQWVKTSPFANAAYLITSFTEDNVDQAIALTQKAGLKHLYHYGKTFENWGHFDLYKGEFPNGVAGLKMCVEKAAAKGIKMGTHCLSNFITTNDPYVTPIPDPRMAKVGSSKLVQAIGSTDTVIEIAAPDFFNQMKNNTLKTVVVNNELIRYGGLSEAAPWRLLDCQRGAFGTQASDHSAGTQISKLLDHGYKVFLTDADLTIEMSKTLAELYNKTGLRQISFDGLEGNRSTGLGTYGESLMPYTWYNALKPELKDHLIIDASRTTHFFWHIYSRMNWGEPWYAGFRESQTQYRFNNQAYFQRNFMPGMLGWFKMTAETSLEDMEWMLAKSAGYTAGYALVADTESVAQNGNTDQIFQQVGDWEKLRLSNVFNEGQKAAMRDNDREFTLNRIDAQTWNWQEVHAEIFTHAKKVRQPGEPLHSTFEFDNPAEAQTLQFVLTAQKVAVDKICLEINGYNKIQLPTTLHKGQRLRYSGGDRLWVLDEQWKQLKSHKVNPQDFRVKTGDNSLSLDAEFKSAETEAVLKLEVKTLGKSEKLSLPKTQGI